MTTTLSDSSSLKPQEVVEAADYQEGEEVVEAHLQTAVAAELLHIVE